MFSTRLIFKNLNVLLKTTKLLRPAIRPNLVALNQTPLTFLNVRNYSKSKDKKSSKGKRKVEVNVNQLAEVLDVNLYENQMKQCINNLKDEYVKNLSLRSTTGAIDNLKVSLEGKDYTLQDLAQIVRKNPKTIILNMAIFPQAIPAVILTLQKSGMNLNPQQDGTSLFIPVPKVTKEHREGLAKNAKVLFVRCRDSIRDEQNKHLRNIKKQTNISKDLSFDVQAQVIVLADKFVAEAEQIFNNKQSELLGKES